jgi:signal transduction histidine kinase
MDTESVRLSQGSFTNTAQKVNPLTLGLSGTIEPVFPQEYKGSLMQYSTQSTQIGQQITQIILTSPDSPTLLARIAQAVGAIFQVDSCLIVAGVNPTATSQLALWSADGHAAMSPEHQAQLLKHLVLTDGLTGGELLVIPEAIPDLQASDIHNAFGWYWEVLSARAVLKIYTQFQSLMNGVIVLGRSHPYEWTSQEKELLIVVSESVAIAISQVQLTAQVLAAARHQTLLNQLSLAMHSALGLEEILQMAIAGTTQALQVDQALLLLLKYADSAAYTIPYPSGTPTGSGDAYSSRTTPPNGQQDATSFGAAPLTLRASVRASPLFKSRPSNPLPPTKVTVAFEWFEETAAQATKETGTSTLLDQSFWLSESSLCQEAFRNAPEPIVIADAQDAPNVDVSSESLSIFNPDLMPALLIVPLVGVQSNTSVTATVLGFFVLQHSQPRPWRTDEIELVKWVSTQVSATIIQNQTLRQVQALVEERTAQLKQSLEAQGKLYQTTRQQMEQLQQLNQLKDEFTSTMSHELRTPLTTMSLAIRMLRQPTLPSQRREKYLEILEQQCNREIELINDLLDLQRLESDQSQIQPQKIDLMLLINELAQSFEQKWADKRLTLTVETPERSLILNTDPDSLNRILLELLTNAGKYSDPDTTVCLKIAHQVQQSVNQVILTLSNTGPGISPTDLAHIFEKFRRGQGVTQQAVQGTGLGLALVKCLVHNLNGTIDVESCPSENSQTFLTSFTLTLPKG